MADPRCDGLPSLLSDLELHGTRCLLLHVNRPCGHMVTAGHVLYPKLHQIAGAELAVDREIEQGEFSHALGQLKTYPDRLDLLEAERRLLSYELALVPGFAMSSVAAFGLMHGGSPRSETTISLAIQRFVTKRPFSDIQATPKQSLTAVEADIQGFATEL